MPTVKIGIVIDPLETLDDAEHEILSSFRSFGIDATAVVVAYGMHEIAPEADIDALIIDYGGLSRSNPDRAFDQVGAACRWAEEHPGKPMVLWTAHTQKLYRDEFQKAFRHLPNILARYRWGSWELSELTAFWDEFRSWIGETPEGADSNADS